MKRSLKGTRTEIIKESNKTHLAVDVMLYFVYVLIGYLLIRFPQIEELKPIEYAPVIFYTIGFFSLLAYFINRRKGNYEFLFLGLINIATGTFITFNAYTEDTGKALGYAILIYSLLVVLNKGYHTIKLSKEKNINSFAEAGVTIMLVLLGFLVLQNLFKSQTMQTLILGYYFLVFGIFSLIEIGLILLLRIPKINKYFEDLINDRDTKNIKPEEIKKIKGNNYKIIEGYHHTAQTVAVLIKLLMTLLNGALEKTVKSKYQKFLIAFQCYYCISKDFYANIVKIHLLLRLL